MSEEPSYVVERCEHLNSSTSTYRLLGAVRGEKGDGGTFYIEVATFIGGILARKIAKALNEGKLDD